MISTALLAGELAAIRRFLDRTLESVDSEIALINQQEENGEFVHHEDYANALFFPMEREAIAVRAVLYEIVALVEWELRMLVHIPLSRQKDPPKPKFAWDLSWRAVRDRVEQYHEVTLPNLPGFRELELMRQTVNAFKHRKGLKDPRLPQASYFPEMHDPKREDAYRAIDTAQQFLRALWQSARV
jgi:hypothetical protein